MSSIETKIGGIESLSTVAGVLYSEEDDVAWVELNRPMAANSLNSSMASELRAVWTSLRTNTTVKAVILIGTGTEAFTVGLDSQAVRDTQSVQCLGPKECGVDQHVIVAVNGIARKEAQVFLRDADVVVAAEHVTIDVEHYTRAGSDATAPTDGASVGRLAASATDAQRQGFVDAVVPLQELRQTAERAARGRIAGSPAAERT